MRHQLASVHELAQVPLLAGLAGETLGRLAGRMIRRELQPGETVVQEGGEAERFYVVLTGVVAVEQRERGARSLLRPGSYFGEVALLVDLPRTATVTALTPATVASCDRATFDEFLRPLFADEEEQG